MLPVVLNGDGLPTDVSRLNAWPQGAPALRCCTPRAGSMAATCRSTVARSIVTFWDGDHSATDLTTINCSRHHHLIHEGGWTLTMTADRIIWKCPTAPSCSTATAATAGPPPAPASTPPGRQPGWKLRARGRCATAPGAGSGIDDIDSDGHARRIVHDLIRRRQREATEAANRAAARQQRRRRHDAPEPLPLFGTDDAIQHRGPPQAS